MIYFLQTFKKAFNNFVNKDTLPNVLEQTVLSSLIAFFLFFDFTQNPIISLIDYLYVLPLTFLLLFLIYYFWYSLSRTKDFEINISKAQAGTKDLELDETKGIRITVKKSIDYFNYSLLIDALTLGLVYIPVIGFSVKLSGEEISKGKVGDLIAKFFDLWDLNESEFLLVTFLFALSISTFLLAIVNKIFVLISIVLLVNFLIPWELILNSFAKDYIKKLKPYVFTNIGLSFLSPVIMNEKPRLTLIGIILSIILGFVNPILTFVGTIITAMAMLIYSLNKGKNP